MASFAKVVHRRFAIETVRRSAAKARARHGACEDGAAAQKITEMTRIA